MLLVDFGISKIYDPTIATTMGARAVTPGYSPPEQYGRGQTDARTDIYALGATLYTLLTGQEPPESVELVTGNARLTPPHQLNPGLSPAIEKVLLQAMATGSTQRFQNASEFHTALNTSAQSTQPLLSPKPKRNFMFAALFVILLLFIGGGIWLWQASLNRTSITTQTAVTPVSQVDESTVNTVLIQPTAAHTQPPIETTEPTVPVEVVVLAPSAATTEFPTPIATFTLVPTKTKNPTPTLVKTATRTAVATTETETTRTAVNPTGSIRSGNGLPLDFAEFGVWVRGNEANGAFAQSSTQVHSGSSAAKLSYEFSSNDNDYVVFQQANAIEGTPNALQVWVYGDGSGHYLNAWITDNEGQTWQVPFGQVFHSGWKQMTGHISTDQSWPWTHISGPDNQKIDYPISFRGFVFDDYTPDYTGQGAIYLDDLTTTTTTGPVVGITPIVPTLTPASGNTPIANASTATPVSADPGVIGRILYTSGNTLLTTDPNWTAPVELGTVARDTCNNQASTVTGITHNLYTGNYCGVGAAGITVCTSPNGLHEAIINSADGGHSIIVRPVGSEVNNFVFQGRLDHGEGIRWSPLSDSFLFVVGDSVNRAFPNGSYTQVIPTAYTPTFSPDGSMILYRKPIGPGVNDVFVSNSDGSGDRNVTNVAAIDKRCPAWRN
ncbi:MAG: hypothetical protein M5U34_47550 [Chloroflexi bacterium]|nr:hypothetical protein [Chloroflexota bacterium]